MIVKPVGEGEKRDLPEKHVSISQLGRYRRCGYQDYLYAIHGPMAPGIAQVKGAVTHDVAAENHLAVRDQGAPLPIEFVRDRAADLFVSSVEAKGLRLTDQEVAEGEAAVLGDAKDWTITAAAKHGTDVAPIVVPDMVEVEMVSEEPMFGKDKDIYLVGRLDLTDAQKNVRDLKTTGNKQAVSQRTADTSPQLSIYYALYNMAYGEPPNGVMLDGVFVGPKRKRCGTRNVEYLPVRSDRDWHQVNHDLQALDTLVRAREAEIFMPVDASSPSGWICSRKWCGYTEVCPYYRKERD